MEGFKAKLGKKHKVNAGSQKQANPHNWRTGWDSNPRAGVTDKLISSVV